MILRRLVSRLHRLPLLIEQTMALMHEGIGQGIVHPRVCMTDVPSQIRNQILEDPRQSPMLAALAGIPVEARDAARARLIGEAEQLYARQVKTESD